MNDKLKYCLCTEATDITFPYFRVMLTSFLKYNSGWFKGKLVILTCDITPLSKANRKIIKKWYNNVEYVDIKPSTYALIKCSDKEKIHLYKTEVFNLDTYDIILYVSHLSLCLSDCSPMFKGDADVTGCNSDELSDSIKGISKRPTKIKSKTINTSVLLLSNEVSKYDLANYILDSIVSKRVSKKNRDMRKLVLKHTNDSFMRKSSNLRITGLPSPGIMKKSIYGDHKTKKFNSLIPAAYFIELDVGIFEQSNSASNRYKNVNKLWLSHNKDEFWYDESNVSKAGPLDLHHKRIEYRLQDSKRSKRSKRNRYGISVVSASQIANYIYDRSICLVANSSELLDNELGEFIDSHDIVVRFNGYEIDKKHTGEKTDVHCVFRQYHYAPSSDTKYKIVISGPLDRWVSSIKKVHSKHNVGIFDFKFPSGSDIEEYANEHIKIPTSGLCAYILFRKYMNDKNNITLIGFNGYMGGDVGSIYRKKHFSENFKLATPHAYELERDLWTSKFRKINEISIKPL